MYPARAVKTARVYWYQARAVRKANPREEASPCSFSEFHNRLQTQGRDCIWREWLLELWQPRSLSWDVDLKRGHCQIYSFPWPIQTRRSRPSHGLHPPTFARPSPRRIQGNESPPGTPSGRHWFMTSYQGPWELTRVQKSPPPPTHSTMTLQSEDSWVSAGQTLRVNPVISRYSSEGVGRSPTVF